MYARGIKLSTFPLAPKSTVIITQNTVYTQEKNNKKKEISRFSSPYEEQMAERPISVRLPVDLDKLVRSLPNRTEWLRRVIAEAVERENEKEVV